MRVRVRVCVCVCVCACWLVGLFAVLFVGWGVGCLVG